MVRLAPSNATVLIAAALLALATEGCGSSGAGRSPTAPTADPGGTYTLVSARDRPLPAVVSENPATGFTQEVVGGFVVLGANQSFTWRTDYRYTQGGIVSTTSSTGGGSYGIDGTVLTLTYEPGGERLLGALIDGVMTLQADVALVYRK